jgi:hypothetical protein
MVCSHVIKPKGLVKPLFKSRGESREENEGFFIKRIFMNILEKANEICNLRKEEKERQYGPFEEGMERAAKIASGCTGKDITPQDMYLMLVALKLSRQSYNHKEDNLLDAVAYLAVLNDYNEKITL